MAGAEGQSRRARRSRWSPGLVALLLVAFHAPAVRAQDEVKTPEREAALKLLADAKALAPDERLKAAEAAIARDRTCARAFLERARARLAVGRKAGNLAFTGARAAAPEDLAEAARLDPGLLEATWELANLAEMTPAGREKLRRGYLESIRNADPDGCLGSLAAGRLRAIDRDYRGALEMFTKAIELDKSSPLAFLVRARHELLLGDAKKALVDVDLALEKGARGSAEALVLHALARRAVTQDDVAVKGDLEKAIAADPTWSQAYGLRALVTCEGLMKGWEADADKALTIDDHEPFALLAKAEALGLEEPGVASRPVRDPASRRRARDLLDRCVERDDTFVPALMVRTSLAIRDQAYDEASRDCDGILGIEPLNARAIALRGVVFLRQGESEKAKVHLDKALEIDTNLEVALLARGELAVSGKPPSYDEAIRDLDRVLHLAPDSSEALYLRGKAKLYSRTRRNRFEESVADLTKAIETGGADVTWGATAYLLRGIAHQALKDYREAIADFDEAEKLAGPHPAGSNDLLTLRKQRAKAIDDLERVERREKSDEKAADEKKPDEPRKPDAPKKPEPD